MGQRNDHCQVWKPTYLPESYLPGSYLHSYLPIYLSTYLFTREAGSLRQGSTPEAVFMDAAFENDINRLVATTKER